MNEEPYGIGREYHIPDALWLQMVRILPPAQSPEERRQASDG
jgi:hypothetical protein